MNVAGIVLAGGHSRRMGLAKAMLPFGAETMLQRALRLLGEAVSPVVVVARVGQPLPDLPRSVPVLYDRREDCGPLEGLAVGLEWLQDRAEMAFLTGCDAPLLKPAFVRRMIELAEGYEIAVPQISGLHEPLAAVYRTRVLSHAQQLLAAGRRMPAMLFDLAATRRVGEKELVDVDPGLETLFNVNTPSDYLAALKKAGLQPPQSAGPEGAQQVSPGRRPR